MWVKWLLYPSSRLPTRGGGRLLEYEFHCQRLRVWLIQMCDVICLFWVVTSCRPGVEDSLPTIRDGEMLCVEGISPAPPTDDTWRGSHAPFVSPCKPTVSGRSR